MDVRLKILHGKFQDKQGHATRPEITIRGPRFVIGSDPQCSLCCQSRSVSPRHCELLVDQREVRLRPLSADQPTRVNGQPVEQECNLQAGDHLAIGRLEFEVLIAAPTGRSGQPPTKRLSPEPAVDDDNSQEENNAFEQLLEEGDEQQRKYRQQHPESRYLHVEPRPQPPADEPQEEPETAEAEDPAARRKSGKKHAKPLPGKLPKPEEPTPEDSTEAAQDALRKLFSSK